MTEQPVRRAAVHESVEWSFASRKPHADPLNEVELDALVTGNKGSWPVQVPGQSRDWVVVLEGVEAGVDVD